MNFCYYSNIEQCAIFKYETYLPIEISISEIFATCNIVFYKFTADN